MIIEFTVQKYEPAVEFVISRAMFLLTTVITMHFMDILMEASRLLIAISRWEVLRFLWKIWWPRGHISTTLSDLIPILSDSN